MFDVESLVYLSKPISYLTFSSCDFHSFDCTCVKCYSLDVLYPSVKYCKCKLPLISFARLHFAMKSNLLEKSIPPSRRLLFWSLNRCNFILFVIYVTKNS